MQIEYAASKEILDALIDLGRTEDLKLSPSYRRLALAGFAKDRLLVIEVSIDHATAGKRVVLTDFLEIRSPSLHKPHGLFFIDEEHLVVANREGETIILKVPPCGTGERRLVLPALQTIRGDSLNRLHSPGSVSVSPIGQNQYEVLVCNNFVHYVTRHVLDGDKNFSIISNETLLGRGLSIPDGVAANRDGRWIAISNHNEHSVYLYEKTARLNQSSEPEGILRNVSYPHGVRFTPEDDFVLVADAGAPYVHVYAKNGADWRGVRDPVNSFRVMDEATFLLGHHNPQEGGPKGIDIDGNMDVLVTTTAHQPLAFFELAEVLKKRETPTATPSKTGTTNFP